MGANNVAVALTIWGPQLGRYHASRVALIVMANTAKDGDDEPAYWGGPVPIAVALGLGDSRTLAKQVSYALKPLLQVGAITVLEKPSRGRRAKYGLNLKSLSVTAEAPKGLRRNRSRTPVTMPQRTPVTMPNASPLRGELAPRNGEAQEDEGPQGAKLRKILQEISGLTNVREGVA